MSIIDNVKISELAPINNIEPLTLSSLFMVSELISNNTFLSKKLSCNYLENDFINTIEKIKYFNPTGTWQAISGMTIPKRSVLSAYNAGKLHCVVNKEYLLSAFFKEFDDLSTTVKTIIPSSVGEIIYSTTLRTENDVRKRYGNHTSWVKVPGRFILATNSPNNKVDASSIQVSDVNQKGGEITTELTINHIPRHYHTFIRDETTQRFEHTVSWTPENTPYPCLVQGDDAGECKPSQQNTSTGEWYAVEVFTDAKATESGQKEVIADHAYMYGNHNLHAGRKRIFIKPNSGGKKTFSHNNIPPYYAMYIWERVS